MKKHWRHGRTGQTSFWDRLDMIIQNSGLVERNLLQKLKIPNVDYEEYGCLKYDACGELITYCYPVVIF